MTIRTLVWLAIGIAAGVTHATALWRSLRADNRRGHGMVWRLPVVVGVLIAAAVERAIISAAVGWAAGLTVAGTLRVTRSRPWM